MDQALNAARHLAENGVPLFLAEPDMTGPGGTWKPDGGHGATGYRLPARWQQTPIDPSVVDRWAPGMALCAVTGHTVDLLDRDTQKGGALHGVAEPVSYGQSRTPSGGTHDFIAALGCRSKDGVLPGVDVKSGEPGGAGRGFAFLPPTRKLSKVDGEIRPYSWEVDPDLSRLVLVGGDSTGGDLARLLDRNGADQRLIASWDGPAYADLDDDKRRWADEHVASIIRWWESHLSSVADWPEGATDDRGRGWEALARDCAWAIALLAVSPWTGVTESRGEELYLSVLPDVVAADPKCGGKWTDTMLDKASMEPIDSPPWDSGFTPVSPVDARNRPSITVASPAEGYEWLRKEAGRAGTPLAGLFLRGLDIVHTPRMGEEGYEPMTGGPADQDGPAQVRSLDTHGLRAQIQSRYNVTRVFANGGQRRIMFPLDATDAVTSAADRLPALRHLSGVTHTPTMRPDGSVLDQPGYDEATRKLYLPEAGFTPVSVPNAPTAADITAARELLLSMLADFPFNSEHDRANYLSLLLTPLLREIVGPPYKLVAINAHQRGSGKSLLAWIARTIHGGVMRGDTPGTPEEFRKQITSILGGSTGAVVQFDNVTKLKATQLDSLLTSRVWSDRMLGASREVTYANDRVWVATGNNIVLGGDLPRRVLWVTIDPKDPEPEKRTNFAIRNLEGWVVNRRGELLAALLTLVRAWAVAGRPVGPSTGEDSYARWIEICQGVLTHAEIDGVVGHRHTNRQTESDEDEDWAAFLEALDVQFGTESWTAKDAALLLDRDDLPTDMKASAGSIGKWLTVREGRWAGGRCAVVANKRHNLKIWAVRRQES